MYLGVPRRNRGTSCLGLADQPTSSVGCGDLWQGCTSAPELKSGDWGGVQVPRPDHTFPRPLMEIHQEPGCVRTKPLDHLTKLILWSSNKYLSFIG